MDGRTHLRTHTFETGLIRSTLSKGRPKYIKQKQTLITLKIVHAFSI